MDKQNVEIQAIPAFSDNYIWLIRGHGRACAVVDPGDHRPVMEELERQDLELAHVLITHHHPDHTGGLRGLLKKYPANVTGPRDSRISDLTRVVAEGDVVALPELGMELAVLEVPGHTRSHIAFYGDGALFCGDTLFSIGCGRLFEGSAEQMQSSLDKFSALPPQTRIYCAHEYTQSNCRFALQVEPGNTALQTRAREVDDARTRGERTVPSTLADELAANPFMRTRATDVVNAARKFNPDVSAGAETMAVIRAWKDRF